jgi:hypothetical protein
MIIEADSSGPFGDTRRLRIVIEDGVIEVRNTLAKGNNLQVRRPVYGYESVLWGEIERLRTALRGAMVANNRVLESRDEPEWVATARALLCNEQLTSKTEG